MNVDGELLIYIFVIYIAMKVDDEGLHLQNASSFVIKKNVPNVESGSNSEVLSTLLEPLVCQLTWTMVSRFCRDVDAVLMTDVGPMVTTVT